MMFTEAERAEIGAELRRLRAEGKDRVHVLTSREGWRVIREGRRRGKAFEIKDEAVAYGRDLAKRLQKDLVVHTKDGGYESWESFAEPAKARQHALRSGARSRLQVLRSLPASRQAVPHP